MDYKTVELKNGKKILLRHIKRSDVDCIWSNFNQIIDEGNYLPIFNKVTTEWEKRTWFQELVDFDNICLVAEDLDIEPPDNVICACPIQHIQWDASEHVGVLGIIIRIEYRKIGLGYHLIKFALDEAKKHGKKKIILSVFATNIDAIRLYEKIGFKKVGVRKKQFYMNDVYVDEVLMEIWIGDE